GEWRDAAGDQRRDGPAQDVAGATDAERRIRLIVDIGLLPVRHDRDRTLEHDDRSPVARMSLGEGHPGGTGWHDTAGETSGFAIASSPETPLTAGRPAAIVTTPAPQRSAARAASSAAPG